ncbi:MAG TPA: hypothetical protein VN229_05365, partial [Terriglobales bacterium]|nr:hypothetical protein [Terriglobales bacterium]
MQQHFRQKLIITIVAWAVAIIMFFPIFWMVLTGFKTEVDAVASPPQFFFKPTLESYAEVQQRANYVFFAWNSILISVGATICAILLAVPAAYSMAFFPTKRTRKTLLWMLSTKMLPPVGVLVPIYLLMRDAGLLDNRLA